MVEKVGERVRGASCVITGALIVLAGIVGSAEAPAAEPATNGRYVFQLHPDLQRNTVMIGDTMTGQAWICTATACTPMAAPGAARPGGRSDCIPAPPPGFKVTDPNAVICK